MFIRLPFHWCSAGLLKRCLDKILHQNPRLVPFPFVFGIFGLVVSSWDKKEINCGNLIFLVIYYETKKRSTFLWIQVSSFQDSEFIFLSVSEKFGSVRNIIEETQGENFTNWDSSTIHCCHEVFEWLLSQKIFYCSNSLYFMLIKFFS